jgi:hypothetical protein
MTFDSTRYSQHFLNWPQYEYFLPNPRPSSGAGVFAQWSIVFGGKNFSDLPCPGSDSCAQ